MSPRTDGVCVPTWALQVLGHSWWTLERRTARAWRVPLGDAFASHEVFHANLAAGDLLLFAGGWQPYAWESDGPSRHFRGAVAVRAARSGLWDAEGVAAMAAAAAVPATGLLAACPDLHRVADGLRRGRGGDDACAAALDRDSDECDATGEGAGAEYW